MWGFRLPCVKAEKREKRGEEGRLFRRKSLMWRNLAQFFNEFEKTPTYFSILGLGMSYCTILVYQYYFDNNNTKRVIFDKAARRVERKPRRLEAPKEKAAAVQRAKRRKRKRGEIKTIQKCLWW